MLSHECDFYNYADDNTILYFDDDFENVKIKLEYVIDKMLTWFEGNSLRANPDKFQLITFNRNKNVDSTLRGICCWPSC